MEQTGQQSASHSPIRSPYSGEGGKKARAPHTKSRQGCLICKKRRVKCNEERPRCRACQIRNEVCTYPETPSCSACLRSEALCVCNEIRQDTPDTWIDFELGYHYGRYTYDTLFVEPVNENAKPLFQPPGCLKHAFLMDLFLALAAAHLATLNPPEAQRYAVHAIRYQNRAFTRFSGVLMDPKVDDCLPMFLFSNMLGILQLALSRVATAPGQRISAVETLVELQRLWRGSKSILQHSKAMLGDYTFSSIFDDQESANRQQHLHGKLQQDDFTRPCYGPLQPLLDKVEEMFPSAHVDIERFDVSFPPQVDEIDGRSPSNDEACKIAVGYLRRITTLHANPRPAILLAWPVIIPKQFLDLLMAGDARAQAISACYGFVLRRLNDRWWAQGFGQDLILELATSRNRAEYGSFYNRVFESALAEV